jgi:hypothetical protein
MTGKQGKAEFFREQNLQAAEIISADPNRYPGVMQEWARLVLNPPAERPAPAVRRAA